MKIDTTSITNEIDHAMEQLNQAIAYVEEFINEVPAFVSELEKRFEISLEDATLSYERYDDCEGEIFNVMGIIPFQLTDEMIEAKEFTQENITAYLEDDVIVVFLND